MLQIRYRIYLIYMNFPLIFVSKISWNFKIASEQRYLNAFVFWERYNIRVRTEWDLQNEPCKSHTVTFGRECFICDKETISNI